MLERRSVLRFRRWPRSKVARKGGRGRGASPGVLGLHFVKTRNNVLENRLGNPGRPAPAPRAAPPRCRPLTFPPLNPGWIGPPCGDQLETAALGQLTFLAAASSEAAALRESGRRRRWVGSGSSPWSPSSPSAASSSSSPPSSTPCSRGAGRRAPPARARPRPGPRARVAPPRPVRRPFCRAGNAILRLLEMG